MLDIIMDRRSIRKFTPEKVTEQQVEQLLQAAVMAPSAQNRQPWHFIVCDDKTLFQQFQQIHPYSKMLDEAPLLIVVCGDTEQQAGPQFYLEDCAAATENILLAAHALGLGACWLGLPPDSERQAQVQQLFRMPEHIKPFCGIALGVPAQQPSRPERKLDGLVHKNIW